MWRTGRIDYKFTGARGGKVFFCVLLLCGEWVRRNSSGKINGLFISCFADGYQLSGIWVQALWKSSHSHLLLKKNASLALRIDSLGVLFVFICFGLVFSFILFLHMKNGQYKVVYITGWLLRAFGMILFLFFFLTHPFCFYALTSKCFKYIVGLPVICYPVLNLLCLCISWFLLLSWFIKTTSEWDNGFLNFTRGFQGSVVSGLFWVTQPQ